MKRLHRLGLILIALVFVASGSAKFVGAEAVVRQFEHFVLPHWFMLLTGAIEICAATMLLLPGWRLRAFAASLLALTMTCGAAFHLIFDPPSAAIPATILAAITALVAGSALRNRVAF